LYRSAYRLVHALVGVLIIMAPSSVARSETNPALTTQQWREDLHYLASEIPMLHPDVFHTVTRAAFDADVAQIDNQIPSLTDHEIELEFVRLVAMRGEGHSRLSLPGLADPMSDVPDVTPFKDAQLAFHRLPLKLYEFADGLYVAAASPDLRALVGARVVRIGDKPALEALAAVVPLVNRDNEMGIRLIAPGFVTVPEVLQATKVVASDDRVTFVLMLRDGKLSNETFTALPAGAEPQLAGLDALPLYLRRRGENFWMDYVVDTKMLFVKINVIQDSAKETFAGFAASVGEVARSHAIDKAVIDFRGCHGGDNQKFRSLLLTVVRNAKLDRLGRLFVITDRDTFSAAVNAVSDFERLTNAIFVGEPPSGSPNSWGDPKKAVLPNSGLVARISTIYWRDWTDDPTRPFIAPDIPVALSSADYFASRDPSLDAISRFPSDSDFSGILDSLVRAGADMKSLLRFYYQHKTDPEWAGVSTEAAMQRVGTDFLEARSYKDALLVFEINAQDYPDSLTSALRAVRAIESSRPNDVGLTNVIATLKHLAAK